MLSYDVSGVTGFNVQSYDIIPKLGKLQIETKKAALLEKIECPRASRRKSLTSAEANEY